MNTDNLFTFITAQDEYHCLLEKMMLRAVNFYSGIVNIIENVLTENHVQMEKACLKEEYATSAFFYIKQLEEIVIFGLNTIGVQKLSDDLRETDGTNWNLTQHGESIMNFPKNKNKEYIDNLKKGQTLELKDYQWKVKLNLFKHYFNVTGVNYNYDDLLYYKRNHFGHANPIFDLAKEQQFEQFFPSSYQFMVRAQGNLRKYSDALVIPINR